MSSYQRRFEVRGVVCMVHSFTNLVDGCCWLKQQWIIQRKVTKLSEIASAPFSMDDEGTRINTISMIRQMMRTRRMKMKEIMSLQLPWSFGGWLLNPKARHHTLDQNSWLGRLKQVRLRLSVACCIENSVTNFARLSGFPPSGWVPLKTRVKDPGFPVVSRAFRCEFRGD